MFGYGSPRTNPQYAIVVVHTEFGLFRILHAPVREDFARETSYRMNRRSCTHTRARADEGVMHVKRTLRTILIRGMTFCVPHTIGEDQGRGLEGTKPPKVLNRGLSPLALTNIKCLITVIIVKCILKNFFFLCITYGKIFCDENWIYTILLTYHQIIWDDHKAFISSLRWKYVMDILFLACYFYLRIINWVFTVCSW